MGAGTTNEGGGMGGVRLPGVVSLTRRSSCDKLRTNGYRPGWYSYVCPSVTDGRVWIPAFAGMTGRGAGGGGGGGVGGVRLPEVVIRRRRPAPVAAARRPSAGGCHPNPPFILRPAQDERLLPRLVFIHFPATIPAPPIRYPRHPSHYHSRHRPPPSFPRKRESTPRRHGGPERTGVLDSGLRRNDGGGGGSSICRSVDSRFRGNDG